MIREKIVNFLINACWPSKVKTIIGGLVKAIIVRDPVQTLKSLLPRTCEAIDRLVDELGEVALSTDPRGDNELHWYLILFAELLRARGDTLLVHKETITSVFQRCLHIIHKGSYHTLATAARHLLQSLTHVYLIDPLATVEMSSESDEEVLPTRVSSSSQRFVHSNIVI